MRNTRACGIRTRSRPHPSVSVDVPAVHVDVHLYRHVEKPVVHVKEAVGQAVCLAEEQLAGVQLIGGWQSMKPAGGWRWSPLEQLLVEDVGRSLCVSIG